MENLRENRSMVQMSGFSPLSGNRVLRGAVYGAVATGGMDLLLIGMLCAAGMPAFSCFLIVGDTIAGLFAFLGFQVPGGILSGIAAHYIVGPLIGAGFGFAVSRVKPWQSFSRSRLLTAAVIFSELASLPLVSLPPIFLRMPAVSVVLWFVGALIMHMIWGTFLGWGMYSQKNAIIISDGCSSNRL